MANILDSHDNKTNLLFKQFQGKAQANIATSSGNAVGFQNEPIKGLNMVFQENILSDSFNTSNIPATQTITSLYGDTTIPDSSWNNNIWDQTLSTHQLTDLSGQPLPLTFYKRVYLNPVLNKKNQAWWLLDASNSDSIPENNVLNYMIPFGYNGSNVSAFRPIVEYFDTAANRWVQDPQGDKASLNWIMDPATGILQLYQTDTIINNKGIDADIAITDSNERPRISFIKYSGNFGTGSGNRSAAGTSNVNVGLYDGCGNPISSTDVSAIYFDNNNFDISYVDDTARISFINTGSAAVSDLSHYFFDVPNDLSGHSDISMGSTGPLITLDIIPPLQAKSALPFGDTLQYGSGGAEEMKPIYYLPYFKELKIEYKDWSIDNNPLIGWQELIINNTSPKQSFIPHTVRQAILGAGGGASTLSNASGSTTNPPFVNFQNNQLSIGGRYQFRLYLTNEGDELCFDSTYNVDASYNYLYLPAGSGNALPLGAFGFATPPTNIDITPSSITSFTISGSNNNSSADTSLNIPFSINPALNYQVLFGFDVSKVPLASGTAKQMNPYRTTIINTADPSFSYETSFQLTNNFSVQNSDISNGITVFPETKYQVLGYYTRNNTLDNSNIRSYAIDGSNAVLPVDPSYTSGIPTRSQAGAAINRMQDGTDSLSFTEDGGLNTHSAIPITGGSVMDVFFLSNPSNYTFTINGLPNSASANNKNTSDNFIGNQSVNQELTMYTIKTSESGTTKYTSDTNKSEGYLTVSDISVSSLYFELSASCSEGGDGSAGSTEELLKKGYYTNVAFNSGKLKSVSLTSYPDICNNSYDPYEISIKELYNDGSGTFVNGEELTGDISIGEKPGQISYALGSSSNPVVNLVREFFGLKMPDARTSVTHNVRYDYDLNGIALWWRPDTTNLTKANLKYNNFSDNLTIDTHSTTWASIAGSVPNVNITPSLQLNSNLWANSRTSSSGTPTSSKYSRDIADIGFSGSQFRIETDWNDNVTYYSSDYSNREILDVSFGTPGKYLWWDTTWDQNNTIQIPTGELPHNFLRSNQSFIDPPTFNSLVMNTGPVTTLAPYDHGVTVTSNNQAIWANGAFRGPSTSGSNNPYIDYASNFYNLGNVLKDYSTLAGQGYTVSASFPSNSFWANNTTTLLNLQPVKFFTFEVTVPNTSSTAYQNYELDIRDDANNTVDPYDPTGVLGQQDGFVLYQNEIISNGNVYPPASQSRSYNGLLVWNGFSAVSSLGTFDGTKNSSGVPSSNKWKIVFSSTASGVKTVLQLSIGIPADQSIGSVTINFLP